MRKMTPQNKAFMSKKAQMGTKKRLMSKKLKLRRKKLKLQKRERKQRKNKRMMNPTIASRVSTAAVLSLRM